MEHKTITGELNGDLFVWVKGCSSRPSDPDATLYLFFFVFSHHHGRQKRLVSPLSDGAIARRCWWGQDGPIWLQGGRQNQQIHFPCQWWVRKGAGRLVSLTTKLFEKRKMKNNAISSRWVVSVLSILYLTNPYCTICIILPQKIYMVQAHLTYETPYRIIQA